MSDDQRLYSNEEFALILREAEMAGRADSPELSSSSGFTLAEMKAAAAQVGLDPALVERAARTLATRATASPLDRLIGGPMRHTHDVRFPVRIDETRAAQLLSAVRIGAGVVGRDSGHSGPTGMTWHDGGESEVLNVTARPEESGTSVSIDFDRRGRLVEVVVFSGMGVIMSFLAGMGLSEVAPALGVGAAVAGVGGVFAAARGYWVSSTRRVRERISAVVEAMDKTLKE